jgi:hypothetical protein
VSGRRRRTAAGHSGGATSALRHRYQAATER